MLVSIRFRLGFSNVYTQLTNTKKSKFAFLSQIFCLIWANAQSYPQFYRGANFVFVEAACGFLHVLEQSC